MRPAIGLYSDGGFWLDAERWARRGVFADGGYCKSFLLRLDSPLEKLQWIASKSSHVGMLVNFKAFENSNGHKLLEICSDRRNEFKWNRFIEQKRNDSGFQIWIIRMPNWHYQFKLLDRNRTQMTTDAERRADAEFRIGLERAPCFSIGIEMIWISI